MGGPAAGCRARPGGRTRRAQRASADRPAGQRGRGRRGHRLPGQPAGRGHHGHRAGRGRRHAGPADPAEAADSRANPRDFRYLSEALTPDEALALLERGAAGRDERIAALHRDGYPAYSTGPGWLGYSDERLAALCEQAVAEGFSQVKIKVGAALADDKRRCAIARSAVGEDVGIAIDANQVWDVPTAIAWIGELAPFRPAWVEEPTAPEDILGTAAIRRAVRPVPVATGEHVANPVMFKQLLQAAQADLIHAASQGEIPPGHPAG